MPSYIYEQDASDGEGLKHNGPSLRELLIDDVRSLTLEFRKLVPEPKDLIKEPRPEQKKDSIKIPKPPLLKDIERIDKILKKEILAQTIHERLTEHAKKIPHRQWYWFMPFAKDLKIELLKVLNKPEYRLMYLLADDNRTIHQDNQDLKKENSELKQQLAEFKSGTKYQQMVDRYENLLQSLKNENNYLKQQAENSKQELEKADEQIEGLTNEVQALQEDKDNLHSQNVKLIEENKILKARIEALEQQLKNDNSSLPRKGFG